MIRFGKLSDTANKLLDNQLITLVHSPIHVVTTIYLPTRLNPRQRISASPPMSKAQPRETRYMHLEPEFALSHCAHLKERALPYIEPRLARTIAAESWGAGRHVEAPTRLEIEERPEEIRIIVITISLISLEREREAFVGESTSFGESTCRCAHGGTDALCILPELSRIDTRSRPTTL